MRFHCWSPNPVGRGWFEVERYGDADGEVLSGLWYTSTVHGLGPTNVKPQRPQLLDSDEMLQAAADCCTVITMFPDWEKYDADLEEAIEREQTTETV